MRVGLLANIKPEQPTEEVAEKLGLRNSNGRSGQLVSSRTSGGPTGTTNSLTAGELLSSELVDLFAEWDSKATIDAVALALESHPDVEVEIIEAVPKIALPKLMNEHYDIVFNLAEGFLGAAREAQFPALLEMLNIPYTGSGPLSLAIALDKARTKEILAHHGVPVARFVTATESVDTLTQILPGANYPVVVKPVAEGSGKGIRNSSFVQNDDELNNEIERIRVSYKQAAIIEEFLPGREFTVAVLGNGEKARVLPVVEINFAELPKDANPIYGFEAKWIYDVAENPLDIFSCPARITNTLRNEIESVVLRAYEVLECKDWSRIDVRLDARGRVNIIEINPLPGILPNPEENSCYPKAARAAGLTYEEMMLSVLKAGCDRYAIPFDFQPAKIS
jgi:D-alanine-D-alanine ligase